MSVAHERIPVSSPAAVTVFQRILTHGPIGRTEIARQTGLSPAAVTKTVAPLIAAGFVTEARQATEVTNGRPVYPLMIDPDRASVIGVKVTATRAYAARTDLAATVLSQISVELDGSEPSVVVSAVTGVVDALRTTTTFGVGVSVSGDVDPVGGVVRRSPLLGWPTDVPLQALLEAELGLPVALDNDVHALTYVEHLFGLARDSDSFAVVTIGEGVGCGVFVNGSVVRGTYGVAGELGHLPLADSTALCTCGRRGCVEAVASSRSIIDAIEEGTGVEGLDLSAAIALGRAGIPAAREAFTAAGRTIGSAIAALVNLIGPELVVITGEGVEEFDLVEEPIRRTFGEQAFGAAGDCELAMRPHSFFQWARGAAVVMIRRVVGGPV